MAYVYRHVRLDKNEVFYIGVGFKDDGKFQRAYQKGNRPNKMWQGIVRKTPIEVEIMLTDLEPYEALAKEMEFIALYKRKCHGGTLVNLTDGGDGTRGLNVSEETRALQSAKKKGKPGLNKGCKQTEEARKKMSLAKKGKPSWNTGIKYSDEKKEKMKPTYLKRNMAKGDRHHAFGKPMPDHVKAALKAAQPEKVWNEGLKWDKKEFDRIYGAKNKAQQKVLLQFTLDGVFVARFNSGKEAHEKTGLPKSSIAKVAAGTMKQCHGFLFRYESHDVND